MGTMDNADKEAFIAHMAEMLSLRDDMLILAFKGLSPETRQTALNQVKEYGEHIWNDLLFFVASVETVKSPEPDESDSDFQMWANELNN